MDIEMQEPYHLLRVSLVEAVCDESSLSLPRRQGLNVVDLEDLLEDIRVYHELEKDIHFDYWNVCWTLYAPPTFYPLCC